jgi:hypothetical protein
MALSTIKTTYAFDAETVRLLERLARRWAVSKSEALRRANRAAASAAYGPDDPLAVLDALQRSVRLAPRSADRWARTARADRRLASARREPHR